MDSGIDLTTQSELENALRNKEAKKRLCTFFEVLMKINKREKLVKIENEDNKRDTGNSSKS